MLLFQTAPGARSAWLSARGRGDGAEQEGGRGETRRKRAAGRRSVGAEGLVLVDSKRHQGVCVCVCVCVCVEARRRQRETLRETVWLRSPSSLSVRVNLSLSCLSLCRPRPDLIDALRRLLGRLLAIAARLWADPPSLPHAEYNVRAATATHVQNAFLCLASSSALPPPAVQWRPSEQDWGKRRAVACRRPERGRAAPALHCWSFKSSFLCTRCAPAHRRS